MGSFADLVESEFHRGKKSLIVSLDCVGAFDQIKLSYSEETLHQSGSPIMITSGTICCSLDALQQQTYKAQVKRLIIPTMESLQNSWNGEDPFTMASLMQRVQRRVCGWGIRHGLSFNPNKMVLF